jgi:hypothetical protein
LHFVFIKIKEEITELSLKKCLKNTYYKYLRNCCKRNVVKRVPWKTTKDCSKEIQHVAILKRSIDARQKAIKINLKVAVYLKGELLKKTPYDYPNMEMLQRRKK